MRTVPFPDSIKLHAKLHASVTTSAGARIAIAIAGAALALGLAVLLNMAVKPATLVENMSGPYRVYGASGLETAPDGTSFRWTTGHATITFPYAANLGRHAHVSVRMASNPNPAHAGGEPPPANV